MRHHQNENENRTANGVQTNGQPLWHRQIHSHHPAGTISVTLTCCLGVFRGVDTAGIAAYSSALQQGTEGPQLTLRRCTSKTLGTALGVDPTRLSNAQRCGI